MEDQRRAAFICAEKENNNETLSRNFGIAFERPVDSGGRPANGFHGYLHLPGWKADEHPIRWQCEREERKLVIRENLDSGRKTMVLFTQTNLTIANTQIPVG